MQPSQDHSSYLFPSTDGLGWVYLQVKEGKVGLEAQTQRREELEDGQEGRAAVLFLASYTESVLWQLGCLGTKSGCNSLIRYLGIVVGWKLESQAELGEAELEQYLKEPSQHLEDWLPWVQPWQHW